MTILRIVDRGGVDQVCISSQDINYCLTQLLITTISSSSLRVSTKSLGFCQDSRLTVSQLGFFFFIKLEGFLFFIGSLALLAISIYLLNVDRGLKCSLRLGFNGFIEYFVSEV